MPFFSPIVDPSQADPSQIIRRPVGNSANSQPNIPGQTGNSQTAQQAPSAAPTGKFDASMTPDQAEALANQYLQAAGLPPDTGGMWGQYWTQFGSKDPNYFQTRLLNGMQQQGGNMAPWASLQSSTAPGGWGPGTSGYGPGGGPGGSSTSGPGGFSFDPNSTTSSPGYQFALQQALVGENASLAARGTALSTGAGKDLAQYANGVASQWEPTLYNQALGTFQTNFNNLGSLTNLGANAASQQGSYITQAGNANAAGQAAGGNIWGSATNNIGSSFNNAFLYNQFAQNGQAPSVTGSGTNWLPGDYVSPTIGGQGYNPPTGYFGHQ